MRVDRLGVWSEKSCSGLGDVGIFGVPGTRGVVSEAGGAGDGLAILRLSG